MRPIALWATPRTASTAFDKMVRTRGDLDVLTEPFSVPYYDGPEQRSTRFAVTEPDATFEATLAAVLGGDRPRFIKEMAYQLGPLLRAEVLERFERWCAAVGVDHRPRALHWEPGMPEGWERWSSWFAAAAASTGFTPPPDGPPPPLAGRAAGLVEQCRPTYEAMAAHRL